MILWWFLFDWYLQCFSLFLYCFTVWNLLFFHFSITVAQRLFTNVETHSNTSHKSFCSGITQVDKASEWNWVESKGFICSQNGGIVDGVWCRVIVLGTTYKYLDNSMCKICTVESHLLTIVKLSRKLIFWKLFSKHFWWEIFKLMSKMEEETFTKDTFLLLVKAVSI